MKLNVNLNLSKCNCELLAIDNTEYSTMLDKLIFIEFLCYFAYDDDETSLLPIKKSKKISSYNSTNNYKCYKYITDYDGRYIYSKYGVYNPETLLDSGEYKLKNKIFCYNNEVYLGLSNVSSLDNINSSTAKLISNWYTLKDYIGTNIDYYYSTELFTFCKLNKCVINYQKQTLFKKVESCNKICKEDNKKSLRDFLFISVYVLDYLVCTGNYAEAQRILENLSACGELCNDSVFISSTTNCNCKNE